jgi:putative ABC transport system permease protein
VTTVATLWAAAGVLLVPLAISGARHRTLLSMALRNIGRRRGEAALVVAGALLGTAIITSSFVVGDVIERSFAETARTRYGPVDLTVAAPDEQELGALLAAVKAAGVDGVDGLLPTTTAVATLAAQDQASAMPQVTVAELDIASAREFGSDPRITGLATAHEIAAGETVLNEPTAEHLGVVEGDTVHLHAYGTQVTLQVRQVVPEVGLAGYAGAIVTPGTLTELAAAGSTTAVPPRGELLVSVDGGVFDTPTTALAVTADLQEQIATPAGLTVVNAKAAVLEAAERQGTELTTVFGMIGSFSVLAGILLLVNLFVMLAEERKTELGMLRAVGFTRRRLIRAFAIEGAVYAILAALMGALAGLGIGWLVAAVVGPIFGADRTSAFPLVIQPVSLAIGAGTGLVISLLTIWITSLRIARLNIIRAIRDLPEPDRPPAGTRMLLLGAVGILAGIALSAWGFGAEAASPLLLGLPLAAFSAGPLLRHLLPKRLAGALVASTILGWGLAVDWLFPAIMTSAEMDALVAQGVVLTAGAVTLAGNLDRVWGVVIEFFGRGGRGTSTRLGIAYPVARRFRTSMLLAMFSLVIFTMTLLTSLSASLGDSTDNAAEDMAAGFDLLVDSSPASPLDGDALAARTDVAAVAALSRHTAEFRAQDLEGTRTWPITGYDAALLTSRPPALLRRATGFPDDEAAYQAVLADPSLAIVPANFLVTGADSPTLDVGGRFAVVAPDGRRLELTIAAVGDTDWLEAGALVSREVTTALLGEADVVTRHYVRVADGSDPESVAGALSATFLANGADARTFVSVSEAGFGALTGFLALLRGFLGFGLLVGIAGLAVVMVRAVRERRREIGMLRAMGFRSSVVRAAMLFEAGLIATQGTVIGTVLGLVIAGQLLIGSAPFGDGVTFVVPWMGLLIIVGLPLAASLAATAWPASRAAAIRPAVALRTAD